MMKATPRFRFRVPVKSDKRVAGRLPASIGATLKSSALGTVNVTISDISEFGCRIEALCRLNKSDTVVLRVDGLDPIGAIVQWHRYGVAGIQFGKRLDRAVVRRLIAALSSELADRNRAMQLDAPGA